MLEKNMTTSNNSTNPEIIKFYKEEFLKHKTRLEIQREFYSDQLFKDLEVALDKIITEIDTISKMDKFSEIASHLLERINVITQLSDSPNNQPNRIH